MRFVICGLSITSSWGNGHATTYRALVRELCKRGHDVLFLEADRPWYASNRDLPDPPYGKTELYSTVEELKEKFGGEIRNADVVIVGSYVADGIRVGEWVTKTAKGLAAFYDIDTPVTLDMLAGGACEYLSHELISRYDLYLSFTGGPILKHIEQKYGSPRALALYCSVDVEDYFPQRMPKRWDLGYLGTYSDDRQPTLERLLVEPAATLKDSRFVVAGAQYPDGIAWRYNIERITHLAPLEHRAFYNSQRFTLNVTRRKMIEAGYSPSVRLFEAAACGTPIISDWWLGLDTIFKPDAEILIARSGSDIERFIDLSNEEAEAIGRRARQKVLQHHTAAKRAQELESYVMLSFEDKARAKADRKVTGFYKKAWPVVS